MSWIMELLDPWKCLLLKLLTYSIRLYQYNDTVYPWFADWPVYSGSRYWAIILITLSFLVSINRAIISVQILSLWVLMPTERETREREMKRRNEKKIAMLTKPRRDTGRKRIHILQICTEVWLTDWRTDWITKKPIWRSRSSALKTLMWWFVSG